MDSKKKQAQKQSDSVNQESQELVRKINKLSKRKYDVQEAMMSIEKTAFEAEMNQEGLLPAKELELELLSQSDLKIKEEILSKKKDPSVDQEEEEVENLSTPTFQQNLDRMEIEESEQGKVQ